MNVSETVKNVFEDVSDAVEPHLPIILQVCGSVLSIGAIIFAVDAGAKMGPVKKEIERDFEDLHKERDGLKEKSGGEKQAYTMKLVKVCFKSAKNVQKVMWKTELCEVGSLVCFGESYKMQHDENLALSETALALQAVVNNYSQVIKEELGEEADYRFRNGIKNEEIDIPEVNENGEPKVDKKTGEAKTKKEIVQTIDHHDYSEFSRLFDEFSPCWEDSEEYNKHFLVCQQNFWNDKLTARTRPGHPGVVFLNEVYESLGLEKSQAGQKVGWMKYYGNEAPESYKGDGYIDFGIHNVFLKDGSIDVAKANFINGLEKSILLDFNVDGIVSLQRKF